MSMFYSIVGAKVMLVVDKTGAMTADPGGLWDDDRDDQDEDGPGGGNGNGDGDELQVPDPADILD